ncbi:alpha/beta fold hydrolase [Candidatus Latescibacterota bacterium]
MSDFIPWNSQPLDVWASKHAQGKIIDLDGCSTHYIEKGEGEPVILLHGFFYDSYLWATNIDILAQKFKVYALDLWGFGYSSRESLDYGYQLYADQVLKFMDSLGIECASILGQSMGGGTAIIFCLQHSQRVNKLLLVDSAGMPNPLPISAKIINLPWVGEFLFGLQSNTVRKKFLGENWIYNKELLTENYFENVTRFHKIKGTTKAMLKILRKNFFFTLSDEIHNLGQEDVPILIVWGREDKGVPLQSGHEMHRILKGSRLEIFDNAGHIPNFECSDKFNQLAVDFLQE